MGQQSLAAATGEAGDAAALAVGRAEEALARAEGSG